MQPNRTPKPIRNLDDKLVCRIDEPSGMVQIVEALVSQSSYGSPTEPWKSCTYENIYHVIRETARR